MLPEEFLDSILLRSHLSYEYLEMLIGLQIGTVEVRQLGDRLVCVVQTKDQLEIVG